MTQYIQDNLPGIDEAIARAAQSELDTECCQKHLANQFVKYGKWVRFSRDPEFKKRCQAWQMEVAKMMGHVGRNALYIQERQHD